MIYLILRWKEAKNFLFKKSCFKNLGKNHSKFVLSLVSYLVSLHPFIDVTEPDINDEFCKLDVNNILKNYAIWNLNNLF